MLSAAGPLSFGEHPIPGTVFHPPPDFGGAIANCKAAFEMVQKAQMNGSLPLFPDYNLDGDRGYAWPCWDVANPPHLGSTTFDPLNPEGGLHITVDPVVIV
jgi:hypothetical protein